MKFLKNLIKKENFLPLAIVLLAGILAARSLLFESGYFNMHDDLQMMRQLELEKCFLDGQIPCRWVPDMGYGYGFPLFNFYPPLPYLIGEVFRLLHFSFVESVKLTFALAFIASGVSMYFLSKQFFGKWGGVISSIFYIWAPYHSVDIYVRGAMNESFGFIWFPLILLFSYKIITQKFNLKNNILLALSWAGLLLSHNLMVLIFTPVFAAWCFIFWIQKRNFIKIAELAATGVFAACLTAFFTIPAILEQKYIHVDTLIQGYYEYIAHFASIKQLLFSRYWGYGPSIWGPNDGMPFQIGQIHWLLSLVILVLALLSIFKFKYKLNKESYLVIMFAISVGWFAAFMTHQNSTFLWLHIKPLAFVQFPWRFLTLAVFGFSFAAGSILNLLSPYKKLIFIGPMLAVIILILNWTYFAPQWGKMGPLTDEQKFNGVAWDMQRTAGIFDYLPKTAEKNPKDPPKALAEVIQGKGAINNEFQGTNWAKFDTDLKTDSIVRVNLYQFPVWKIKIDGNNAVAYIPKEEVYGRMYLNIPQGMHKVELKLGNTAVRMFTNYVSLISWIVLLIYSLSGSRVLQFMRGRK